jgi:hypothetical protein
MQKRRVHVRRWLTLTLLLVFLVEPARILGNWGMEVGRANPGDVTGLIADWNAFKMARNRINNAAVFELVVERQKQVMGVDNNTNINLADLYREVEQYWLMKVLAPLQRIALNPAASCAEAQFALSTLTVMKRQQQLLGLDDNPTISRVFQATEEMASLRCRDEALDECVATGRFRQILDLAGSVERQGQIIGKENDLESWAEDALKQCAIYELHFISKTKMGGGGFTFTETERDGRVPIKFEMPAGGLKAALSMPLGDLLKGKTEGGNNPFFTSIKCTWPKPLEAVCPPGVDSTPIEIRINELDIEHKEFYIGYEKMQNPIWEWESNESEVTKQRMAGKNRLSFSFMGGRFSFDAHIKGPNGFTFTVPFKEWGNNFYIAHLKDQSGNTPLTIKDQKLQQGAHPVLLRFTYPGTWDVGGGVVSDTTEFELIHKPKPKPFPKRSPDEIRRPLKPPPAG